MSNSLWDDLQDVETSLALAKPATKPKRYTDWTNAASFTDGGYLARIVRQQCRSCGGLSEQAVGIFHVELAPNGTRRLQALTRGAQWPVAEGLPLEIEDVATDWCPGCLRLVGFSSERPMPSTYSLTIPAKDH